MTTALVALAGVAATLVGLSKGGLPAIGMLAVPVLSLVMSPIEATVRMLPIYVISDVVGIWLYRREFSRENLRILIPAGLLGVVIGWLTASMLSEQLIKLLIGLMGLGFCINAWTRSSVDVPRKPHLIKGWFWGTLSGFTSFTAHAGAPPFQIFVLPQKLSKTTFAGTATLVFAVINAAKIVPYQSMRPYTLESVSESALLIPFALVGTVVGAILARRIADVWFYRLVFASLFAVSVKLVIDASQML